MMGIYLYKFSTTSAFDNGVNFTLDFYFENSLLYYLSHYNHDYSPIQINSYDLAAEELITL